MNRREFVAAAIALSGCAAFDDYLRDLPSRHPDAPSIMSPDFMVEEMLRLGSVRAGDRFYDLGCGDGRLVIGAARLGARGVGVDIDPKQIRQATRNAAEAGVTDRVRFLVADLFQIDFRDASVVSLYLSEEANVRLRPKLQAELRQGTRIISHEFSMGDWEPETRLVVGGRYLYRWII